MLYVYASGFWVALAVLAVANGAFREGVLNPRIGARAGHVLSTIILSCVIVAMALAFEAWLADDRGIGVAFGIGTVWTALTLAFEFGLGHYVQGQSWQVLLEQYDVRTGHIWPLVLVATLLSPPAAHAVLA